jgi:hypothetical protein
VYITSPSASPGEEKLISDPGFQYYEWANSALRDGRIFVDRSGPDGFKSYLLTPNPGKKGTYQEIQRPNGQLWHKLSVSPSETRVAYMLDYDGSIPTYNDEVICYAAFDVESLRIFDQVAVTEKSMDSVEEYPTWNRDESMIVYDSNRSGKYQLYAFILADGRTATLSTGGASDQFADFEGLPK